MIMADVRCPMCSRLNPADSEVCQYCQARLKPLIAGSTSASDSDAPDWLSGLRDEQGNEFDFGETPADQDDSNDWLTRLGEAAGSEPTASAPSEPPDWMRDQGDLDATVAFEISGAGSEDFGAQPAKKPDDDRGVSERDRFTETTLAPEDAEPAQSTPSAEFESKGLFDEPTGSAAGDFFTEGKDEQPASEGSAQIDWDAGTPASGAFDFLAQQPEQEPAQPSGEQPDWLNWGAPEETPATPAELPDWLAAMSGSSQEGASEPLESEPPQEPDWLRGSATPIISPFSSLDEETEPEPDFGLESDWSAGGLGEPARQDAPVSQPDSDQPDWLASLLAPEPDMPTAPAESKPEPSSLFDADQGASAVPAFSDWDAEEQPPDWLMTPSRADESGGSSAGTSAFSFEDSGDNDETVVTPLGATPDWISQVSAEDAASATTFPAGEEELHTSAEGLEPANLPGWLEAMRPVDAIALEDFVDTSDQHVETLGPLAGLRGTLPVGVEAAKVAGVPVHGLKAQLKDDTHSRVNMLVEMLAAETQSYKAAGGLEFMTGALIRLILFVVLVLTAVWALWYGEQPGTVYLQNAPLSPAANDFQIQLNLLPEAPRVLIAVDAEVAFISEMDAAAESLMTFLSARRAQIVFVSTNPAGPILAEHYIDLLNKQPARGGVSYAGYTNLGFLSGGPAGLVSFLNAPELTTPFDLTGEPAWETPSDSAEDSLAQFSAVIVLTASSETARLWIEQGGPILRAKSIPLLFSVSAQANPFLQPYYNAVPRQVDGILSGLPEIYRFSKANALDQLAGSAGMAQQLVDAYSAVILASVLVLLIGVVVSLVSHLLPTRVKEKKA